MLGATYPGDKRNMKILKHKILKRKFYYQLLKF